MILYKVKRENAIMTDLWSDDKKELEIKAKIISECA